MYFTVFRYFLMKDSYAYNFNQLGSPGRRLIVQFNDRTLSLGNLVKQSFSDTFNF